MRNAIRERFRAIYKFAGRDGKAPAPSRFNCATRMEGPVVDDKQSRQNDMHMVGLGHLAGLITFLHNLK
jgi:hypothetical protein